jgi:imidazole glycerol-phosphate synthase subunit HisH
MTAILKYNAGNVQSVQFALERLGEKTIWTDDPLILQAADRVIFPGVGEASSAMRYLKQTDLVEIIPMLKQPVLGICLGLQLFCRESEENNTVCLGIFDVPVLKFQTDKFKVPHIGWNTITGLQNPLFEGIKEQSYVYFVHGYYAQLSSNTIAMGDYCQPFSAALQRDNFYAVQFHPEKSGELGARILQNFLKIEG